MHRLVVMHRAFTNVPEARDNGHDDEGNDEQCLPT
jgi:hypothetical protein